MSPLDDLSFLPRWQREALGLGYDRYRGEPLWQRITWDPPPVTERLHVWMAGYLGRPDRLARATAAVWPLRRVGERVETLAGLVRGARTVEPEVRWSPEARAAVDALNDSGIVTASETPPPLVIRQADVHRWDPGPLAQAMGKIVEAHNEAWRAVGRAWAAQAHAAWVAAGCPVPTREELRERWLDDHDDDALAFLEVYSDDE